MNPIILATLSLIFVLGWYGWSTGRVRLMQTWHLSNYSNAIAISPDGQLLATTSGPVIQREIGNLTTSGTTRVELRRLSDSSVVRTLDVFDVTSLAFSPDRTLIAVGNGLGQVQIWRTDDGQRLHSLRASTTPYGSRVHTLLFSPDGHTLVSGAGGQTEVWRVADGQLHYRLSHENNYSIATMSPDGQILAISEGIITLYRLSDGTRLRQLELGGHPKFSPDGQLLAISYSSSYDREKVLLYRLQDDTILGELRGLKGYVRDLAFSPDGRYLAATYQTGGGSGDFVVGFSSSAPVWSHLALWRSADFPHQSYPRRMPILRRQKGESLTALAFSPDGKILVSGGDAIRLWRMPG